jgi:hypothetical protein
VYPHLVRSRLAAATFAAWAPRRVWALRGLTGGPSVFTTPETASADRQPDTNLETRLPARSERGRDSSHGTRCDRASDIPVASPALPSAWARLRVRFERGGSRRGCRLHRLVKDDGSYNPGCLPSTGTLRRIRWPLQPRSRDRTPAFATIRTLDDTLAPPWVFAGSAPFFYGTARLATALHAMRSPAFHRRRPLRARPLFTLAGPLLGGRIASLLGTERRLPTSATALRRAGTSPSSRFLAGTEAATSFLFSRATLPSLRKR